MTSQDKWTKDSNFNLQPDFHALPLTQVNLWEFEKYKTTHLPVQSCWRQSLSSFYCENNRTCIMSVSAHSKTHSLPQPRWTEVSKVYTEHTLGHQTNKNKHYLRHHQLPQLTYFQSQHSVSGQHEDWHFLFPLHKQHPIWSSGLCA